MRISVHAQRAAVVMAAVMLVSTAALAQGGAAPTSPTSPTAPAPAATGAAQSTVPDVVFAVNPNPAAEETKIARTAFAGFLATPVGKAAEVQTALVDLDSNGVAQVAVRIKSAGTCTGDRCATVILKYDGVAKKWSPVFERHTSRLQIGRVTSPNGGPPFNAILANGYEIWVPDNGTTGTYHASLWGQGKDIALGDKPTPEALSAAKSAIPFEMAQDSIDASASMASFSPVTGVKMVSVILVSRGCTPLDGCPTVIFIQNGNTLKPVWDGLTQGNFTLLPHESKGMPDIGISQHNGYITARWNGSVYDYVETTYVSTFTGAP